MSSSEKNAPSTLASATTTTTTTTTTLLAGIKSPAVCPTSGDSERPPKPKSVPIQEDNDKVVENVDSAKRRQARGESMMITQTSGEQELATITSTICKSPALLPSARSSSITINRQKGADASSGSWNGTPNGQPTHPSPPFLHQLQDRITCPAKRTSELATTVGPNSNSSSSSKNKNNNNNNNYSSGNTNDSSISLSDDQSGSSISRYRPQKYCAVCGDKAIACNFNAVTCESCKAFFRRNAYKEQRLKCLFDSRCVIDKVTRRFCSKCRLLKCFEIGMKREWILTDEQKQVKRVKILQNKQSKHQQVSTSSQIDSGDTTPRSSNTSAPDVTAYVDQPKDGSRSRPDEVSGSPKRRKASMSHDGASRSRVETCDASTSCPDEADLLSGQTLNYCTMAHQCQYCSSRLQSDVPTARHNSLEQYQSNYATAASVDYHQHANYQQQHFTYAQHPVSYASSQVSSSASAYSQHQMAALAGGNSATGAGTCSLPQTDCCCLSFGDIFQSQRYNRPSNVAGTGPSAPLVINHLVAHAGPPFPANGLSGEQATYLHTMESAKPQMAHPSNSPSSNDTQTSRPCTLQGNISEMQPGQALTSANHTHHTNNGNHLSKSSNPFIKALDAHIMSLEKPTNGHINDDKRTTKDDGSEKSDSNSQEDGPKSSANPKRATATKKDPEKPQKSDADSAADASEASFYANKPLQVAKQETMPDGSPLDKSKYTIWNGIVYAQPAIAESEMRVRIESLDFTETERQLVYEMIGAVKFMFEPTNVDRTFNDDSLNDFVFFCDAALRRLIKTVKQIRAFRILSMDDQITLLKTACFKILLLRSCLHYHDDVEGWRDRHGRVMPLSLLKKAKSLVYVKHKQILTKLSCPLRKDRMIMGLMSFVLLFDPQDNLKHNNSVGLDNLIYLCILRKYLVGTQPDPLEKYERLVEVTHVINACNEEYNVFFSSNFQPEQITPLLIEIFDISINNSS